MVHFLGDLYSFSFNVWCMQRVCLRCLWYIMRRRHRWRGRYSLCTRYNHTSLLVVLPQTFSAICSQSGGSVLQQRMRDHWFNATDLFIRALRGFLRPTDSFVMSVICVLSKQKFKAWLIGVCSKTCVSSIYTLVFCRFDLGSRSFTFSWSAGVRPLPIVTSQRREYHSENGGLRNRCWILKW